MEQPKDLNINNLSASQIHKILKAEKKSNNEINKILDKDRERLRLQVTLLLLGPGESGKSTLVKQLRLISNTQWDESERASYKPIILKNTLKYLKKVIFACKEDFEYDIPSSIEKEVNEVENAEFLTPEIASYFKVIISEDVIKKTLSRASEFLLQDSALYFFEEAERIASPSYKPNDMDILRSRKKTTAISETTFQMDNTTFKVVDVGGQRSQRKKWIHLFQDVTSVIFCASLSCYDQKLKEDNDVASIDDSINLFGEVVNNVYFKSVPVILLLNKMDLLEKKLPTSPLSKVFPDFKGETTDDAATFISKKYLAKNKNPSKAIYKHYTCATDTTNITTVWKAVRTLILVQAINTQ